MKIIIRDKQMANDLGCEIDILPVGNSSKGGDAIALRFGKLNALIPEQKIIVIDGGYKENGNKLIDLIKNTYKSKTIDLVILTHPDKDHSSGLQVLFEDEELKIKKLIMHRPWLNDTINTSYFKDKRKTENSLNKHLQEAFNYAYDLSELAIEKIGNSNIIEPSIGSSYFEGALTILGPNLELYRSSILESDKTPDAIPITERLYFSADELEFEDYKDGDEIKWFYDESTSPINETSIISIFNFAGNKILLTGDAGKKGLRNAFEYANEKRILIKDLKIFQVPHHGSRKNLSPELLDLFKSDYHIISTPPNGDPKHPSRRLINIMNQKGKKVYSTSGMLLNWGVNCPKRDLNPANTLNVYSKIEK